jgi:hypothetical protein
MSYLVNRYNTQRDAITLLNREHILETGCLEVDTPTKARHLRFAQLGLVEGQHPHGYTPDVTCGNERCVAQKHVYLRRWKMFGRKTKGRTGKRSE